MMENCRKAAFRVWFRGMTVYCTSGTNYHSWIQAMLSAAKDIYGDPSQATTAVRWAATAIAIPLTISNVGISGPSITSKCKAGANEFQRPPSLSSNFTQSSLLLLFRRHRCVGEAEQGHCEEFPMRPNLDRWAFETETFGRFERPVPR